MSADRPMPKCGDPHCRGWLGFDDDHRPIPCLKCRDHLIKTVDLNDCDPSTRR